MGMMIVNGRESPCLYYYEGDESKIHILSEPCAVIQLSNDSDPSGANADVKFSIPGYPVQTLKAGEVLNLSYQPFAQIEIVEAGPYRLWVML